MKNFRSLLIASIVTIAMSALAWGQASPLDNFPTPEEVQPLREEAVQVLADIFNDPESLEGDNLNAMFAIEDADHPVVIPTLISVLEENRFASVRRAAARELGELRAADAIPALQNCVENETLASLIWVCGMSVLQMRPSETELLEQLLSDVDILAEAALALQDRGLAADFPNSLSSILVEAFQAALLDRDNYNSVERAAIMQTLAVFVSEESVDLILGILNDRSEESFVRGSAAFVLGELGAIETLPDLIRQVETGDPGIQLGAASAFGLLQDETALDALAALLNDYSVSPSVRIGAAQSLRNYEEEGLDALIENLNNDPVPDVRAASVKSMKEIGSDTARLAVLDFFNSDFLPTCDPFACATLALEAMSALAAFDEGALAVGLLQSVLTDLEPFLPFVFAFQEADLIRVASEIGAADESVFDLLLGSDNRIILNIGIAAFANVNGRDARDFLVSFINEESDVLARRAALEGLEKIALADDIDIFSEWIHDRDRRARLASFHALAAVGDDRALPLIQECLSSDDMSIVLQAADAAFEYANRIDAFFDVIDEIDPGTDSSASSSSSSDPSEFD